MPNAGNGRCRGERHLETRVFQGRGIGHQQEECCHGNRIQWGVVAIEQLAGDQNTDHKCGADDRRLALLQATNSRSQRPDNESRARAAEEEEARKKGYGRRDDCEVESRDDNQVVEPSSLEVAFDTRGKVVLKAKDHAENQTSRVPVFRETGGRAVFDRALQPVRDSAEPVTALQHGDQARIADRAGPEDALALEVALKVENAGIAIACRAAQADDNLQAVAGPEIERVEERDQLRVFQKLRQSSSAA